MSRFSFAKDSNKQKESVKRENVMYKNPKIKIEAEESSIPRSPEKEDSVLLGFERQKMVDWFSPAQLAQTGLRAVISTVFGSYADKREMQAALESGKRPKPVADFSKDETIWIDYTSDLGAGWNSTYSVAYLLGRKMLEVIDSSGKTHELPRGNMLVMGGDEVYPTATWQEYNNRLTGPYRCSLPYVKKDAPLLLSIPGNHDWYDGLSSFIKLFCQGRWLGGWQTKQTRSYFAVKISHNWWLWGVDIQLSADIDKPQLDYFDEMCKLANEGDNIILCTAEPAWVYQEYQPDDKPFQNLEFFRKRYAEKKEGKLNFRLMLTGDLHHYTSFRKPDDPHSEWKITAGGGGAFSHPTHQIPDELHLGNETYQKSAAYPDARESRKMVWNNLKFPFINKSFGAFFAVVYLLFAWFTAVSNAAFIGESTVLHTLANISGWGEAMGFYGKLVVANPELGITLLLVFAGLLGFADRKRKNVAVSAWLLGGVHALIQVLLILCTVWLAARLLLHLWAIELFSIAGLALAILIIALAGWLLSGLLMGFYLLISALLLSTHDTEAFSSFRGQDHKNFMRLRINSEGLTVYPIKIPKAARKWMFKPNVEGEQAWYEPSEKLEYSLIENPINIKNIKNKQSAP
jgi:hypothetical protein